MHIDVLPAMTGVTRFGELGEPWTYSKVHNAQHSYHVLPELHGGQKGKLVQEW